MTFTYNVQYVLYRLNRGMRGVACNSKLKKKNNKFGVKIYIKARYH